MQTQALDNASNEEPIAIVYEEPHFLFVNKPAALFSQAAGGIDSLEHRLVRQLKLRDNHSGQPFVGLPHRLDRGTSGIMLIARNQRALKRFGEQFQSRKVRKFYLAVVEGEVPDSTQHWQDFLRKLPDEPKAEVVSEGSEGAKQAIATAMPLARADGRSLLLVQLETGRMHQIRIQASSRGFPVVGDHTYGATSPFVSAIAPSHAHPPIALHAYSLEIRHPQTAKPLRVVAPVPNSWNQLPEALFLRASQSISPLEAQ